MMKKYWFLLMFLTVIILVSSCTGYTSLEKIQATDYFSGVKCEIPLAVPSALPTSEYLCTDDSMEDLKNKLDGIAENMSGLVTEYLPHNALMVIYSDNSQNALYLFHEYYSTVGSQYRDPYEHRYRFSDFCSVLRVPRNEHNIRRFKGIPIPHHLFIEMTSGSYHEEMIWPIKGSIDEFYDFYQAFFTCYDSSEIEIRKEADTIVLGNIPVEIEYEYDSGEVKREPGQLKQVALTFSENDDDEPYVSFSYILE